MALFGKKEVCPICGSAMKGLFHVKLKDGKALCKDCTQKTFLDSEMFPFMTSEDVKEHLAYRENNRQKHNSFTPNRQISAAFGTVQIDDSKNLWSYSVDKKMDNPPIFSFSDIVDYELTEDGETITKGGVGSAAVGGLLFGSTGAVVGGLTGSKKTKTVVKSIRIRVSLQNKYTKKIEFEFIPFGTEYKVGSMTYDLYKDEARSLLSLLDSMCEQAAQSLAAQPQTAFSEADEIMKFKQLLDSGIITEEEFQAKKKQLLGI